MLTNGHESSVLFSLRELQRIERSRVEEEAAADARRRAAAASERRRAEEEARREEGERARRADALAAHEREMASMRLREERIRIQEAEALARADLQAQLEAHRLEQEMEIRRVEASRKRPTWLVITVGFAVVAAGIAIAIMVQKSNAEAVAQHARRDAEARQHQMAEEVNGFRKQLRELEQEQADLKAQQDEAKRQLAAANTQAARDQIAARQAELDARAADVRRRQAAAQAVIEKRRSEIKPRCPTDQPLC